MEILFSDQNIVVCIKPVGVDSEKQVPELLAEVFGGRIYPLHRLDVNVGGVMVFARNKDTAAHFSRFIQDGKFIKEYVAMVHGKVAAYGDWTDLLFKDSGKNKVFVVKKERKGVKKARLEYKCIYTTDTTSFVHIRLHTGRTHQIRVQFSSRGFPLVGDHKYGSKDVLVSPQLYSCRITFPYHHQIYTFEAYPDWDCINPPLPKFDCDIASLKES